MNKFVSHIILISNWLKLRSHWFAYVNYSGWTISSHLLTKFWQTSLSRPTESNNDKNNFLKNYQLNTFIEELLINVCCNDNLFYNILLESKAMCWSNSRSKWVGIWSSCDVSALGDFFFLITLLACILFFIWSGGFS